MRPAGGNWHGGVDPASIDGEPGRRTMSDETLEERIAAKMRREGLGEATIAAFLDAHRRVRRGERGLPKCKP